MITKAKVVYENPQPNGHSYQIAVWIRVLMFPVMVYQVLYLIYNYDNALHHLYTANEILFVVCEMLSGNPSFIF
jgi:hypothetical protein